MKPRPHRQWSAAETEEFLLDDETQAVLQFLRSTDCLAACNALVMDT
jgi:hypothetical protein